MAEMVRHKILFPGRDCILEMAQALRFVLHTIQCSSSVLDDCEQLIITTLLLKKRSFMEMMYIMTQAYWILVSDWCLITLLDRCIIIRYRVCSNGVLSAGRPYSGLKLSFGCFFLWGRFDYYKFAWCLVFNSVSHLVHITLSAPCLFVCIKCGILFSVCIWVFLGVCS